MAPIDRDAGKPPEPRVVLDDRERASDLHHALEKLFGVPSKIERLAAGDILIARRYLAERKTASDFVASIRDGRLESQVEQLLAQRFEPLFIIEGNFGEESTARMDASAIRSALLRLSLDWRVPVLRSRSISDTALWVQAILKHVDSLTAPPDWRGITPGGKKVPRALQPPRPQRKPMTPNQQQDKQERDLIAAMPGVGPVRAKALMDKFGSVAKLVEASIFDLADTTGIGPRIAESLWRTFHGPAKPPR